MSQILKSFPTKERLHHIRKTYCEIFNQYYNPQAKRNPNNILRKPLKGPQFLKWYGDNSSTPTFSDFKKWFPDLKLVDPRETHRQFMVQDRKRRNKGAPKKKKL
ncbi:unnamed protein product [Candida verbasci]|uniref:Small ribosomal subunit protein mS33 n=1 Tax=Candida verbasci TaxID=1227364 RepID=A0A9W4TX25_9ASCO|nr:unnamed protein product [Candida verbasci]